MEKQSRIPILDIYRFAAAFVVMGYHYLGQHHANLRVSLEYGPIYSFPYLDSIFRYGHLGVNLFFLISGFVIAMSAEGRSFAAFLASRLARIFPTYWLAVLLTSIFIVFAGVSYREVTPYQILVNLIFLQGPLNVQFIDGVYWTILIELRFYILIAGLMALGLYRYFPYFLPVWAGLALLDYFQVPLGPLKQIFITSYGQYFAAGSAFYYLYSHRHVRIAIATVLLSLVCAVLSAMKFEISVYGSDSAIPAMLIVVACFILMALISAHRLENIRVPWLQVLGGVTYPLYLIHEDIGYIFMRYTSFTSNGLISTLLIMAAMLAVAWCIYKYFESAAVPIARKQLERLFSGFGPWARKIHLPMVFKAPAAHQCT